MLSKPLIKKLLTECLIVLVQGGYSSTIEEKAFWMTILDTATLPTTLRALAEDAFWGCLNLKVMVWDGGPNPNLELSALEVPEVQHYARNQEGVSTLL